MLREEWNDFFENEEVCETEVNASPDAYKAAEALAACVNEMGRVNLRWMSGVSGLTAAELAGLLGGTAIFQDPEGYDIRRSEEDDWLLRPQYLTGNIRTKLDTAKRLNKKYGGRFEKNIEALNRALPARVRFDDIGISIGSPWVPADYYSVFAKEGLGLLSRPEVVYSPECHQWKVTAPEGARADIHNIYTYGTKRMPALRILEHTLNANTVKVYDVVTRLELESCEGRVLNEGETLAAQEKQEAMQQAFREWIRRDPGRVKHLEDIFYDNYACSISGRFRGAFLTLPGLNPAFTPYPHQRDAAARIILEKDVLLSHVAGSGKTNIQIIGIHERKRMGLSGKNLVVVPNNVLEAFESAHQYLYPEDRILVIHPEDFTPERRQEALAKIRDEDYVAVYMAFSSFELIHMSRRYKLNRKADEIRALLAKSETACEKWEKSRLRSMAERMWRELKKMREKLPEDHFIPFDKLGITTLAIDEAHHFWNISRNTRADGGARAKGSPKCDETLEKTGFVRENGGGIIFSTGTPLTNSISDLFVLQTFLQPEQLRILKLSHFDEWIKSFAKRRTGFEIDVNSQNYRMVTRFSKFHNLPELTGLLANVCDFYNGSNSGMGLPKCEGYLDTVIPKSAEQSEYMEELAFRTELIRTKDVRESEDNLLKVIHDGRAAALDIRLADPKAAPDPLGTKVYACAKNVFECWKKYPGTAQLVFCDLGTPKKGFNIYDELRGHLTGMGIPEHEIAFIHSVKTDAKRRKLFRAVNKAEIRVLAGSTEKLGTGVNVQERLVAVHHLDVPRRPSDVIQREGRLIRQGNRNERVYRYRYITAGTFDAYSWLIAENKQRFIGRFMSNTVADRDARDLDDGVLTYGEIKALSVGNPLLGVRIETSSGLARAKLGNLRREQELLGLRNLVKDCRRVTARLEDRGKRLRQDLTHFANSRERLTKGEREAFGEALLEALRDNCGRKNDRHFRSLHGFRILLPAGMTGGRSYAVIEGVSGNRYDVDMCNAKALGCIQRIEHRLLHLEDRVEAVKDETARYEARIRQAEEELAKGNGFAQQVRELTERLAEIDGELNRRARDSEE